MPVAIVALMLGCATPAPLPASYSGPTYTRASIAGLTTAALAARLLDPAEAATVEGHWLNEPAYGGDPLSGVHFDGRPRPLAEDICGRDAIFAVMRPVDPRDRSLDPPVRPDHVVRWTRIALVHDCEALPNRRFAWVGFRHATEGPRLDTEGGIAILRWLAFARAAAAGTEPLPFRLRCNPDDSHERFECPTDVRAVLAGLPLHQAISIDRGPFAQNTLCGPPQGAGDSVEILLPAEFERSRHLWEVRLNDMGTDRAEVVLSWAPGRGVVRC